MKYEQHLPTPEEIRRACNSIRKTWTVREYWRRAGHAEGPRWTVPVAAEPRFHFDVRGE